MLSGLLRVLSVIIGQSTWVDWQTFAVHYLYYFVIYKQIIMIKMLMYQYNMQNMYNWKIEKYYLGHVQVQYYGYLVLYK